MVIFTNILMLCAGLGSFLLGMQLISNNLQKLAGGKVNTLISKIKENKLAGISLGAGAAMLLESSSATTVILLGLVNAGMVNLVQATLIIMGANVGTTFTVVIMSLNYLPIGELFSFLTLAGAAVIMASKKEKNKTIGWIISSFGLIFIGLSVMSSSVGFLKESAMFVKIVSSLDNNFLLILIGMLFTAIIQSSSATTGIVITLAEAGILPITAGFSLVLGSNIGSCMTAFIASFGSNINGKRTAFIHFLFNAIGVVLFYPLVLTFGKTVGEFMLLRFSPAVVIAYFHVIFNLVTTIILVPFVKLITKTAEVMLPLKKQKQQANNAGIHNQRQ